MCCLPDLMLCKIIYNIYIVYIGLYTHVVPYQVTHCVTLDGLDDSMLLIKLQV